MPAEFVLPHLVEVTSPVKVRALGRLPMRGWIQFCGYAPKRAMDERDFRALGDFIAKRPDVLLRAYGRSPSTGTDDLEFLRFFPGLRRFKLDYSAGMTNFDGLGYLSPELESLSLGQTNKQVPLRILQRFPKLKYLWLEKQTKDFDAVSGLLELEDLSIRSITLPDLSALRPLKKLRWFENKLGGTKNLGLLPQIGRIRALEIWRVRSLNDLSPIAAMEHLEYLFLQDLPNVERLPSLKRLTRLRRVKLEHMRGITDLSPLLEADHLEELLVINGRHLAPQAFQCLTAHPSLKSLVAGLGSDRKNEAVERMLGLPNPGYRPDWLLPWPSQRS